MSALESQVTVEGRRSRSRRALDALPDARGRRVVLVSHSLLNQSTRYAGGATQAGAVAELVSELVDAGYGIHQLPCAERHAWGGVLERYSLWLHGSKGGPLYPALMRVFVWWTRLVYWRLARQVARDVDDYEAAGIRVVGLVGVGASPSCGVVTTLDLRSRRQDEGMLIQALDKQLRRRGVTVPALEHGLDRELRTAPLRAPGPAPR